MCALLAKRLERLAASRCQLIRFDRADGTHTECLAISRADAREVICQILDGVLGLASARRAASKALAKTCGDFALPTCSGSSGSSDSSDLFHISVMPAVLSVCGSDVCVESWKLAAARLHRCHGHRRESSRPSRDHSDADNVETLRALVVAEPAAYHRALRLAQYGAMPRKSHV